MASLLQILRTMPTSRSSSSNEEACKTIENKFEDHLRRLGLSNAFHIRKESVSQLQDELEVGVSTLLNLCMKRIQRRAVAPVSKFHVGAAALGSSGDIHMGVNLEFKDNPLTNTMHAEQFLVLSCLQRGETRLVHLVTSAPPCGYCRQFLNEMPSGKDLLCQVCPGEDVSAIGPTATLAELLPKSFGPDDLFSVRTEANNVFAVRNNRLVFEPESHTKSLAKAALASANRSYCPYSHRSAGIALETRAGSVYSGFSVENAAYNPTLSPLHGALVALITAGEALEDITACALVEGNTGEVANTVVHGSMWGSVVTQALKSVAPKVEVKFLRAAAAQSEDAEFVRTPHVRAIQQAGEVDDLCLDCKTCMSPESAKRKRSTVEITSLILDLSTSVNKSKSKSESITERRNRKHTPKKARGIVN